MSDDHQAVEPVEYDEFGMFRENAEEVGLPYDGPPVVERRRVEVGPGYVLSALVWGDGPPELVLLHGGAQNAHTWDTVALALGRPLIAIDLPGHGHSDGPGASSLDVRGHAEDVAGGMPAIALAGIAPDLVRKLVLVDVTPGVDGHKSSTIAAFINGPESFPSF